jgi:hypothetical protein
MVVLAGEPGNGRDGHDQQTADRPTDQTTVAYMDGLKSKIDLLERELRDWKEEARRKDHLLAAALERIPAIEAPSDKPPESPRDEREAPVTASEEQGGGEEAEHRQPWWVRWFGSVLRGMA